MSSASLKSTHPAINNEQPDIGSSGADYSGRFSGAVGAWFISVQSQALASMLPIKPHCRILDLGGGHGQNISPVLAAKHIHTILGSSLECKQQLQSQLSHPDLHFVTGSLLAVPFADKTFYTCLSFRMLPHLNQWQLHIKELCRVAAHDVIIEFPTQRSLNAISAPLFALKKGIEKNTRPFALFNEQEVIAQFALHGFKLNDRVAQYFFPMALYRLLGNKTVAITMEKIANWLGLQQRFGSPLICHFSRKKPVQETPYD